MCNDENTLYFYYIIINTHLGCHGNGFEGGKIDDTKVSRSLMYVNLTKYVRIY